MNDNEQRFLRIAIPCFIAFMLCLWALRADAQDRPFALTNAALAGLAAVDLAQSVPCLRSPTCREVGPLYRRASPVGAVAIKTAGVAFVSVAAWKLRKRRPKTAWALLGGLTVFQGAVVVHNARTLRKAR